MGNKTMRCDSIAARRISNVLYTESKEYWATLLDVEPNTILNYRKGKTQLKAAQLKLICEVSHVSVDWILGLK